jgi:hypothetical protein
LTQNTPDRELFRVTLQTAPEHVLRVLDGIQEKLERVQNRPVITEELKRAKRA